MERIFFLKSYDCKNKNFTEPVPFHLQISKPPPPMGQHNTLAI